jgi:hypothetical protein
MDRETQRLWAIPGVMLIVLFGLMAVVSLVVVLSDAFGG